MTYNYLNRHWSLFASKRDLIFEGNFKILGCPICSRKSLFLLGAPLFKAAAWVEFHLDKACTAVKKQFAF